jgi:hypothetical protein
MKLRAKHLPAAILGAAVLLATNPEVLALLLTVQALGLELVMLLVAFQFRSIRHAPLVVLALDVANGLMARSLSFAARMGDAVVHALFPNACLRFAMVACYLPPWPARNPPAKGAPQ